MKKAEPQTTHEVVLTYGIPDPLPEDWMERFGHLSLTSERVLRVEPGVPGRMEISLKVNKLDVAE